MSDDTDDAAPAEPSPEQQARHDRIGQMIGELADHPPRRYASDGAWKARAKDELARVREAAKPAPRRSRGWIAPVFAFAAAAAVMIYWLWPSHPPVPPSPPPVVVIAIKDSGAKVRGVIRSGERMMGDHPDEKVVHVGETLELTATSDGPGELRVYLEGMLIATCSDHIETGCAARSDGARRTYTIGALQLNSPGILRTYLFRGDKIPASGQALEADIQAAYNASVSVTEVPMLRVE